MAGDERFGVITHTPGEADTRYFLEQIGVKWYLNFNIDMSQVPEGATKIPFIQMPQSSGIWASIENDTASLTHAEIEGFGFLSRAEIQQMAEDSPGSYWYVFGEPNRYGYMDGDRFAPVFEYFRTYLLAGDSTAKIISPGVLNWEWTCYQLCGYQQGKVWVEEFVDAYESRFGENPPVDVWAIHTYPIDWTNTPNNDPDTAKQPTYKGSKTKHSGVVIDQLEGMREYLNGNGYADTPIWIGEIAIHVGFDGWQPVGDGFGPVGDYRWDNMRDYISEVLDWLETNAASNKIEKWFFFKTWKDIQNPPSFDPYMGYVFFNESGQGTSRNCLGDLYRARSLGEDRVKCDANGNTVLE